MWIRMYNKYKLIPPPFFLLTNNQTPKNTQIHWQCSFKFLRMMVSFSTDVIGHKVMVIKKETVIHHDGQWQWKKNRESVCVRRCIDRLLFPTNTSLRGWKDGHISLQNGLRRHPSVHWRGIDDHGTVHLLEKKSCVSSGGHRTGQHEDSTLGHHTSIGQ